MPEWANFNGGGWGREEVVKILVNSVIGRNEAQEMSSVIANAWMRSESDESRR